MNPFSTPILRVSEAQRSAIGLLGKTKALGWIARRQKLMPKQAEAAWRSPNRAVSLLGDGGEDGLGYDFEAVRANGDRWRYEVKASTGDLCEFELGPPWRRRRTREHTSGCSCPCAADQGAYASAHPPL